MGARRQILENLQAKLEEIRLGNGYLTDIGQSVRYWQDTDIEYGETALEFRDTIEDLGLQNIPYEKSLMVEISAYQASEDLLTASSDILEDIEKCLGDFTVEGGIAKILNNQKTTETKGKKTLKIKVTLRIQYREEI